MFRVAAFYGGIAFVIVQIIDGTFEVMGVPPWVSRLLIVLLAAGFPLAMVLAWVFDITPQGIVRTGKATSYPATLGTSLQSQSRQLAGVAIAGGKPLTSNRALIVVAVLAVAFGLWSRWGGSGATAGQIRSIAVLPFESWGSGQEEDYFTEGITEEIITRLSRLPNLKVIARTSVMQYKGTNKRVRIIGEELGVGAVLEGSVRRSGGKVRITGQLIDTATEGHLWAESYDREVNVANIFELQDDVARAIAEALRPHLVEQIEIRLGQAATRNPQAYDLYLQARYYLGRRTETDILQAIETLKAAIATDPQFARAYAELANAYNLYPFYVSASTPGISQLGMEAIDQALRLDPNSAAATTALAGQLHFFSWRMEEAEAAYLKAITLDPGYVLARHWYAIFLASARADYEGSRAQFERALQIDPFSPIINTNLADMLFEAGRYEEAEAQYWHVLGIEPEFYPALYGLGITYMLLERYGDAEMIFDRIQTPDLAWAWVVLGKRPQAQRLLDSLATPSEGPASTPPLDLVAIYASLGMADSVGYIMATALREQHPGLLWWRRQLQRAGISPADSLYQQYRRRLAPGSLRPSLL